MTNTEKEAHWGKINNKWREGSGMLEIGQHHPKHSATQGSSFSNSFLSLSLPFSIFNLRKKEGGANIQGSPDREGVEGDTKGEERKRRTKPSEGTKIQESNQEIRLIFRNFTPPFFIFFACPREKGQLIN